MQVSSYSGSGAPAGFLLRAAAFIIDNLAISALVGIVSRFTGIALMDGLPVGMDAGEPVLFPVLTPGGFALVFVLGWLYAALLESSVLQATAGKLMLRLLVTDAAGQRISFARASARYVAKITLGQFLLVGFVTVLFSREKRALYDSAAGTRVLRGRVEAVSAD